MHRLVAAPVGAVRRVPHHCRKAVEARRLGKLSADRGLDVLTFFLSDVQTGFGPFISIYLIARQWSVADVGTVLGIGTIVAMVAQIPAGAAIDAIPVKRGATLAALLAVLGSAALLALYPRWTAVIGAQILYGIAAAMLVPAVAAVTLSRVGRQAFPVRLGRNARFMALGSAIGAVLMGVGGAKISPAAPFWIAAVSTLPAIFALLALPPRHPTQPKPPRRPVKHAHSEAWRVLLDRRLLVFVACIALFQAANGFIVPLAMARLAAHVGGATTNLVLAASLLVSQGVVATLAPFMGHQAEERGRRPVLIVAFLALPVHALALAAFSGIPLVVGAQLLDGIDAAMFGVLMPLVAADVTHGTNRFNLVLGVLGLAIALGGTVSAAVGGRIAGAFGDTAAFLALAAGGIAALLLLVLLMPETRVPHEAPAGTPEDTLRQS